MRVVCPSCQAAYDVPANVVAARRTMRCARCGAEFAAGARRTTEAFQPGESAPAAKPPPPESLPPAELRISPEDRPPATLSASTRARPGRKLAVLASWALSLLLLCGGAWAFVAERSLVLHAWPASNRIYALFGKAR